MLVSEVLVKAADLIEPEGKWTRYVLARDVEGNSRLIDDPEAVCFCMEGAVRAVSGWPVDHPAVCLLETVTGYSAYGDWNDDEDRTQDEVVAKLREAAALAKEQGK